VVGGSFRTFECFPASDLGFLAFPVTFLTFGLFAIVLNAIIFGLAAYLVTGFRLRWGI
jgi:putative membrane protein